MCVCVCVENSSLTPHKQQTGFISGIRWLSLVLTGKMSWKHFRQPLEFSALHDLHPEPYLLGPETLKLAVGSSTLS